MAAHPDHRQGLEIAARASRAAVGEEQRAAAYERLLAALAGTGAPAGPAPAGTPQAPEPLPAGEVLPGEAEIDAFLEEVLGSDPDVDRPRITLALAPGLPEGRILLAEAQIANGRLDEARAAAEQARSLAPDRPGGHVMLSMVAAQAGEVAREELDADEHDQHRRPPVPRRRPNGVGLVERVAGVEARGGAGASGGRRWSGGPTGEPPRQTRRPAPS